MLAGCQNKIIEPSTFYIDIGDIGETVGEINVITTISSGTWKMCYLPKLAPPGTNELGIYPTSQSIEKDILRNGIGDRVGMEFHFIESNIILTPQESGNGREVRFGFWMPNQDTGDDYVLVSRPGVLTPENIMLAYDLLRSM